MKKIAFVAVALLFAGTASAQTTMTSLWAGFTGGNIVGGPANGTPAPAIVANDNLTRGGGLIVGSTEASDVSAFVVQRGTFDTVNNAVRIINSSNGQYLRSLNNTGISGGTFPMNVAAATRLGADTDASIFLVNLINSTGSSGAGLKVYRYASDSAATPFAQQIANDALSITSRAGDTMNVVGSGTNVTVYVAGNNAGARVVAISTTDGGASWTTAEVGPTRAALGVAGDVPGGSIFLKSGGADIIEYNQAGTVVGNITTGSIDTRSGLSYAVIGGAQLLANSSYASGTQYVANVYDITNRGAVTLAYTTEVLVGAPTNTNTNGTSALTLAEVDNKITVFSVTSNNVYALYQGPTTSVSDWQLITH